MVSEREFLENEMDNISGGNAALTYSTPACLEEYLSDLHDSNTGNIKSWISLSVFISCMILNQLQVPSSGKLVLDLLFHSNVLFSSTMSNENPGFIATHPFPPEKGHVNLHPHFSTRLSNIVESFQLFGDAALQVEIQKGIGENEQVLKDIEELKSKLLHE